MKQHTFYLSGPMSGYPEHNYPAFYRAELELIALGHDVINPARIGEMVDTTDLSEREIYEAYMTADLAAMEDCDAIYYLKGWNDSAGANREREKAMRMGLVEMFEGER